MRAFNDADTGDRVWSGRYDAGSARDVAQGTAVDAAPGGGVRIFVTGRSTIQLSEVSSDTDYATVAYLDPWGG